MKLILEPIFEADFHDCSYGYRPRRSAKMASLIIREDLYRRAWRVVEIDLRNYFTTIPHDKLLKLIGQRVVDGSMLRLIKKSLKVVDPGALWRRLRAPRLRDPQHATDSASLH